MSKFLFILEYNEYINDIINSKKSKYSDEYIYNLFLKNTKNGKLLLKEGLIYSQSIEKTIKILENRFKELNIKTYDDGDISIEGMDYKLSKYLPLINNLGYFISAAFKEDKQLDLTGNIEEILCDNIFIEPKYDRKIKNIPKKLYHASPLKFKDKILKNGLTPKSGNKLSNHPDRIYLSDSILTCIKFGKYLIDQDENDFYKNGYCIYIIDGKGIDNLYSDINLREGGFYTLNNIKKDYISLFKKAIK